MRDILLSGNQGVKKPNQSLMSADEMPLEGLQGTPALLLTLYSNVTGMHRPSPEPCKAQLGGNGSLYLDSSGRAPTEFWSEELEEAGNERVRSSSQSSAAPDHGPSMSLGRGLSGPRAQQAAFPAPDL